jgi:beta-xylosidase
MKKISLTLFTGSLILFLWAGCAKAPQLPTFLNTGNPLVKDKFTADPAPLVHNGTLYLYVGHDEYYEGQDTAGGGHEFNITEWLCYSTTDMQTWTDHGTVLRPSDFSWGVGEWSDGKWDVTKWGVGEAWASQVIEHNGKFYYYVTAKGGEPYNSRVVGVAVSDSPTGPFVDPIGKPLVSDDMTPNGPRGWWNDIDPTALVDQNGQAWLCWGNGSCFLAKLKPNMVEIDGEIKKIDMPRYIEGPWLSYRNGTYYLTYASFGRGGETINYATAPSMEAFYEGQGTPQGELTGAAKNSFTIHPGIIDFKGKSYLFYHNATITLDGHAGAIGRRSVCVDELHYNPDGTMQPVEQTEKGVSHN